MVTTVSKAIINRRKRDNDSMKTPQNNMDLIEHLLKE